MNGDKRDRAGMWVISGKNVTMEVKRGVRNSILLSTLIYGFETWTGNRAQQSKVHAVEISYLSEACDVTKRENEPNGSMNEMCGMGTYVIGVVYCSGMGEKKYIEVVWSYVEDEE